MRRGVVEAIVVDQDLQIISGHQRWRACKELGIVEIPCRVTHYPEVNEKGQIKENMILEDLICTNIMQRGVGNVNPMKMAKCVVELERIYGIRKGSAGGNGSNQYATRELDENNFNEATLTQKDLADQLGVTQKQLINYKKLNTLIPELQDLVESDQLKATTAHKIWAKLSPEEQKQFFEEIGLEKVTSMTQKDTERIVKEKKELEDKLKKLEENNSLKEEENEQLEQVVQSLNKKLKEQEAFKSKMVELEEKLRKAESEQKIVEIEKEKIVEKKIVPEDYERLKRDVDDITKAFKEVRGKFNDSLKEANILKEEIKTLIKEKKAIIKKQNETDPEVQFEKNLKQTASLFKHRITSFIEDHAGLAWLAEYINEMEESDRKTILESVQLMKDWITAMEMKIEVNKY